MGNNETNPKTGIRWRPLTFFFLLFSDCFSLVLHLSRVIVITGSMRRYLDPTEVAQSVQLLQDGTSMRAVPFLGIGELGGCLGRPQLKGCQ